MENLHMEWLLTAMLFFGLCALVGGALWLRRGAWGHFTRIGFGVAGFAASVAVTGSLLMALGVDHGVYEGMSKDAADTYFWAMLSLGTLGFGAFGVLLFWFVFGVSDPLGQLRRSTPASNP
jgi:hypothetical protein